MCIITIAQVFISQNFTGLLPSGLNMRPFFFLFRIIKPFFFFFFFVLNFGLINKFVLCTVYSGFVMFVYCICRVAELGCCLESSVFVLNFAEIGFLVSLFSSMV